MRARILPPEEWSKLEGTDLSVLLPFCAAGNIHIPVVEDESGRILAHVAALQTTHFEGLSIVPERRGDAGVFRALIRLAYSIPRGRGEEWAIGGAANGDTRMESLIHRLGGRELPIRFYAMSVKES